MEFSCCSGPTVQSWWCVLEGPLEGLLGGYLWVLHQCGEGDGPATDQGCTPGNSQWYLLNLLHLLTQMPVLALGCLGTFWGVPTLGAHQVLLSPWIQAPCMFPLGSQYSALLLSIPTQVFTDPTSSQDQVLCMCTLPHGPHVLWVMLVGNRQQATRQKCWIAPRSCSEAHQHVEGAKTMALIGSSNPGLPSVFLVRGGYLHSFTYCLAAFHIARIFSFSLRQGVHTWLSQRYPFLSPLLVRFYFKGLDFILSTILKAYIHSAEL